MSAYIPAAFTVPFLLEAKVTPGSKFTMNVARLYVAVLYCFRLYQTAILNIVVIGTLI
jgi:hypothetical protein